MSKYFMDCEFIEGKQDKTFLGIKYGGTKPLIDLISIGIVSEDIIPVDKSYPVIKGREYYAISKDFNLKAAWKNEWVRENVLEPIEMELFKIHCKTNKGHKGIEGKGSFKVLQWLLNEYGKTNKQIAQEIIEFVYKAEGCAWTVESDVDKGLMINNAKLEKTEIEFYGYYSASDWVAFYQLFGTMMNLPSKFPYYCKDLKFMLDEKAKLVPISYTVEEGLKSIKMSEDYPKQTNEHNALSDAHFNYNLYKFLNTL